MGRMKARIGCAPAGACPRRLPPFAPLRRRRHFVCLAGLLFAAVPGVRAELRVWTGTETRHVLRSQPPGQGLEVRVAAARNEWVSFQILARADRPVRLTGLKAADLRGPGGAVLRGADARLYRQHQLFLGNGTHRNTEFKPDGYPDPLIPFAPPAGAPKWEPVRLAALPFDLPANETHGFWVDLFVPDAAEAGEYRGVYQLAAGAGQGAEIPVALTVWDFALPATPALVTEFGSPRLRDHYRQKNEPEPAAMDAVEAHCAQLLSEHRCNAVPPGRMLTPVAQPDGSFRIPEAEVAALRGFVDRHHVNALQVPHPSSVVRDPEAERETLHRWLAAFDRAARELDRADVVWFTYLRDEPNTPEDYRYVQQWGRAMREAKSVVKVLVVEQPWTEPGMGGADSAWGDLYGAVDIWCPLFSLHRQESAARRQALGETVWTYTALCQGQPTPWWHIDFPLLNYRVPAWIAWRSGIKGLLYWGGMSYWKQTDDPWTTAPFYTGNGAPQQGAAGIVFQGEGSLVYPARAVGYDGVAPTIRLKALRDSIEDYDYLALLDRRGRSAEADAVAKPLAASFFEWDKDPAAWESARARLAALLAPAAR